MPPDDDFTKAGYRALLEALVSRGYRGADFASADPQAPDLILRHDIDFSPDAALPIAQIESELGLPAVYFFLTRSPFYAVDSDRCRMVFSQLRSMGHEVGLHFDASLYPQTPDDLDSAADRECAFLAAQTGAAVQTVSFHRPAPSLRGYPGPIAGRLHSYQPRYFSEMGYCSDSTGRWRFGHPLDHSAVRDSVALQLLTHPIWWANDDGGDREAALNRLVAQKGDQIRADIADTVTGYDAKTGVITDNPLPSVQ